ncbi:MAG: bifunctional acetate--CoA ligase family protein/GNAT family N-acetyltransferase [Phaeodactylibacter sp.]|nr:bifunctional acetate--CoA ligase family protein/GNAT family N-acetyltransferase [Phaeodactylibacter sp.]MCB9267035.1 bifunctional acetate--CoA ligase family protein/GNAT family N-acetyltransferase [Lewinellaceae bacterium]MCB9289320.1 bifunctional acetate--CoA ligase family protein/GNAT family N-acetyltransferase [Lewinellaceae bacterium]
MNNKLDKIFRPATIAVIGASNERHTVGYALVNNLVGKGYNGTVYPVNLSEHSVQGVRCYHSIGEIEDGVDLALIATPAGSVAAVVKECGQAGVGGAVIISAGFSEAGEAGQALSGQVLAYARKYNMRIVGPNCLGFINPSLNLNATFANRTALPGKIAFISQSGALCTAILDWARKQKVGFSHFVSIGDMIDIGFHDLIDYFGSDPLTSSILIYMESLNDARKFMSAARAFARTKPILVLKAGKSKEGAQATLSHTGSLAGNDAVFEAAFKRAGIIRVETIAQLFNCAQGLALQQRPSGNRLAIITNAGGPGVLATDHLIENGGALAHLSEETAARLENALHSNWSRGNPIDIGGDATALRYREAVAACIEDKNIDGILVILTPQAVASAAEVEREITALARRTKKTILASWMEEEDYPREFYYRPPDSTIPSFQFPESGVDVFLKMYNYTRNIELLYETPATMPQEFSPDTEAARKMLNDALRSGRHQLTEIEAKQLLGYYEMPVTHSRLAKTPAEAARLGSEIGFPVVAKIVSPDIGLKTDIGGVEVGLNSRAEAELAFEHITNRVREACPDAEIFGISVEKMVNKRYELLIGANKDPIFGPVIVFALGGVTVEIFKDSSIGLPPLNMALAKRIIEETKVYALLKGYRGMPEVDIRSIQFMLYKFAYLIMDCPQIKEIDINPFVVDEKGGIVLDAYVILDQNYRESHHRPYGHLVISPYPKQYVRPFIMHNGKKAVLRPIRPEDEPLEAEMIGSFSRQTQYFRFFGFMPYVSKELLRRSTQIDYDREIAIIAEIKEKGKKMMAGEARLLANADNENAEFAIAVADKWHGQGLGSRLTDYIIEVAAERGIRKIYANVLKANTIMVEMFRRRGFVLTSMDHSTYFAELEVVKEVV